MRRPTALLGVLAVLVAALAGCGLGPGKAKDGGAELRVTRDFGQTEIGRPAKRTKLRDSDTVMRFLQSERKVSLKYGGGFVQSIDGLSGGGASGRQDWFYFVNGAEADTGAADHKLHSGDVVQWDYRNWIATMHIPAIVGAFPQPLRDGLD
ncbi:MAG: hypothetical protein QOJ07_649, partial [Thermoleophilaceae bacterium]|nr:hypothetical protein [Thermoleophilaceae bacterium]